MSPFLIGYLVTVAVVVVIWAARAARSPDSEEATFFMVMAILMAAAGPLVLLGELGYWLGKREPRHLRAARRAMEVAELQAREAQAIADRERTLGLRP